MTQIYIAGMIPAGGTSMTKEEEIEALRAEVARLTGELSLARGRAEGAIETGRAEITRLTRENAALWDAMPTSEERSEMRTCARVTGSVHAMAVFAYLNRLPVAESPAPASDAASRFRARAEVTDVAEVPVLASDEGEVCTHCCGRRAVPDGMSTALVHCPRCTGRTGAKGGAA